MIKVEKIPILTCEKCGGYRVTKIENNIECEDCDKNHNQYKDITLNLTNNIEYLIYELSNKEI